MRVLIPALAGVLLVLSAASAHAQGHRASGASTTRPERIPPRPTPALALAPAPPPPVAPSVNVPPPAPPAPFTPAATLVPAAISFPYLADGGRLSLILQVSGLKAAPESQRTAYAVSDVGQPADTATKVDIAPEPATLDATRDVLTAKLALTISKMPADTAQNRSLAITIAGHVVTVGYALTNVPGTKFSWTPRAPASFAGTPGQPLPLAISVGPVSATDVRAETFSFLSEKTEGTPAPPRALSESTSCAPGRQLPIDLAANTTQKLWLVERCEDTATGFFCWLHDACGYGEYDGSALITSREKPEGDTVALAVQSTSWTIQAFGMLILGISVFASFRATKYIQEQVNKLALFAPIARQREEFARLRGVLADQDVAMPITKRRLDDLFNARAEAELSGKSEDELRECAKVGAAWQDLFQAMIGDSLQKSDLIAPENRDSFLHDLDSLAVDPQAPGLDRLAKIVEAALPKAPPATAATAVPRIMGLIGPTRGLMGRLRPRFAAAPPPRSRGARELTDEIDRWNARAFAILTISTALVGFYNLVWTNSFGTTRDLVACVLWGLGLPLGSKAVTTLASVATTLGLNLSRA